MSATDGLTINSICGVCGSYVCSHVEASLAAAEARAEEVERG